MKKSELKQLIKEEIQRSLNESYYDNFKVYEDEFKKRGFKWMEEDYQYGGISDTFYKKFPLGVFSIHIESNNANKWYVDEKPRHEQYYYNFEFSPYPKYKKYLFGLIKSKHPQIGKSIDLGKGNIDFGEGLFLVDDNTFKTEFFSKIDKALDEASKITDVKYMSQEDSKNYSTYFFDQMKESKLKQLIKEEICLKKNIKEDDWQDPSDESQMASVQLKSIISNASKLLSLIEDNTQLDAWVESKLAVTQHNLQAICDYMSYE